MAKACGTGWVGLLAMGMGAAGALAVGQGKVEPDSGKAGPSAGTAQSAGLESGGDLHVYFADVEGGQSTLFVMPGGESLLVDTGSADMTNPDAPRDASRIAALSKLAGVTKIDNLVVTHYHSDHVGGLPQLVARLPVGRFIDHGINRESAAEPGGGPTVAGWTAYQKVLAEKHAEHLVVKPGDVLPVKGMRVEVVSADGEVIDKALEAGGERNPACAGSPVRAAEGTENDRSVGMVLTFGRLRILDLGDLTWAKERGLVCPVNKLGKVDAYIVSHHGLEASGSPALVDAIAPRVAVMDNGAHKGGAPATYETIQGSFRLKDLWQLHTAEANDARHNPPAGRIANLPGPDAGNYLELTGHRDGSFTMTNGRTGETVEYPAR